MWIVSVAGLNATTSFEMHRRHLRPVIDSRLTLKRSLLSLVIGCRRVNVRLEMVPNLDSSVQEHTTKTGKALES